MKSQDLSHDFFFSKTLLKVPQPSQTGSVVWDQVLKHVTLWEKFFTNYKVVEGSFRSVGMGWLFAEMEGRVNGCE